MKENLIKIFGENDVDVSLLNENNISEYLQTKRSIETMNKTIIEPFKVWAKQTDQQVLIDTRDLYMTLDTKQKDIKHSDKEVVSLLETSINSMIMNNSNNKIRISKTKINSNNNSSSNQIKFRNRMLNSFYRRCKTTSGIFRRR